MNLLAFGRPACRTLLFIQLLQPAPLLLLTPMIEIDIELAFHLIEDLVPLFPGIFFPEVLAPVYDFLAQILILLFFFLFQLMKDFDRSE